MNQSTRIPLEGGHADVDVTGPAVELTVKIGDRIGFGLALSPAEAQALADALTGASRAAWAVRAAEVDLSSVRTVLDLWRAAEDSGIPASALIGQVQR